MDASSAAAAAAAFLGFVEGLTEFIPVSSTAHLLLIGRLIGFQSTNGTFEVLIQLGAVLAILAVYARRLLQLATSLPSDPASRRFVACVVLAFLPAAVLGALLHDFIKSVLFQTPIAICAALLVGGVVLLAVDRLPLRPRYTDIMGFPLASSFGIGLFQCLALLPGVSRSGSTIVGALLLGADKRSAAEFSFFLAIPTMAGAFAFDLYKSRHELGSADFTLIAIGFAVSFVTALFVVRFLLDFVSRRGFAPFAWWRIAVGTAGLLLLW